MVATPVRRCPAEPTGVVRVRLVKTWLGTKLVVEKEINVEYRRSPIADDPPLRTHKEWVRETPWNILGRNFYAEAR